MNQITVKFGMKITSGFNLKFQPFILAAVTVAAVAGSDAFAQPHSAAVTVPAAPAADKAAPAGGPTKELSKDLKINIEQIAKVYEFYDCTKTLNENTSALFFAACSDATQSPHVAQVKATAPKPPSSSLVCTFEGDHFVLSVEGAPSAPVFNIDSSGHVSQIIKGDFSVDAKVCRSLFDKKSKTTGEAAADADAAELCFSYYPSKKAVEFRTEPVCAADVDQPRKPASLLTPAAAPVDGGPVQSQRSSAEPTQADHPDAALDDRKVPLSGPRGTDEIQGVVVPENSNADFK